MHVFRRSRPVAGHVLPGRRPTLWALYYFLLYFGGPVIGVALLLDGMLYLVFKVYFHSCYGVFCLLE